MANFRGQWKNEWNNRISYFEKEIGKVEAKNKKKPWSIKFWKKAKDKKKKDETVMSMAFGELDKVYAIANKAEGPDAAKAVKDFEDKMVSVERLAKGHNARLRSTFTSLMPKKEMTKEEYAVKERDVKKLLDILDKDIEALLAVANTSLVIFQKDKLSGRAKAKNEMEAILNSADFKRRKAGMTGAIKKGAAWIAKIDRKPDVKEFNKGISNSFARDLMMEVQMMSILFDKKSKDRKVLDTLFKVFQELGPMQLDEDNPKFELVIKHTARGKTALATLTKWLKNAKA